MKGWKELEIGAVITKPGSSSEYKTGGWRAWRPVFDSQKCVNCMLCWIYCPDAAIVAKNGKIVGVDYDHCKGCGICAHECPTKALEMKPEYLFNKED